MLCLFCVDKIKYTTTECIDVVIRILTLSPQDHMSNSPHCLPYTLLMMMLVHGI